MRELISLLRPPVVVIAVGSDLRGDDAFGIEAARSLGSAGDLPGVVTLEGGVAPENLAERIARSSPRTALILDAADFGGAAGELRLVDPAELGWSLVGGTHAPSLELLADYLANRCGAKTLILACQPGATDFGEPPSEKIKEAARRAAAILRRALSPP